MIARTICRYFWPLPYTLLGLMVAGASALTGGKLAWRDGIIEAHGGLGAFMLRRLMPIKGGAVALACGHVILALDAHWLANSRAHERIHVRQFERWGPLMLPAYVAGSVIAVWRGGHYYFDNPFEREANAA